LVVSDVWKGIGTAIFLELGKLHKHQDSKPHNSKGKGDITIDLQWSWRLESKQSIIVGSNDSKIKITNQFKNILGNKIKSISIVDGLPELLVEFENNRFLHTFSTQKGQPEWALFFFKKGWLEVKKGKIYFTANK